MSSALLYECVVDQNFLFGGNSSSIVAIARLLMRYVISFMLVNFGIVSWPPKTSSVMYTFRQCRSELMTCYIARVVVKNIWSCALKRSKL